MSDHNAAVEDVLVSGFNLQSYDREKPGASEPLELRSDNSLVTKELWIFVIPEHLQYNPCKPFEFSYAKTAIYAVATTLSMLYS